MSIHLEAGTRHVLAWCGSCPGWRVLTGTRRAANLAAADHADRCHADPDAAKEFRRRAGHVTKYGQMPT